MRPPGPPRFSMQPPSSMNMAQPGAPASGGIHGNHPPGMGYQQMMQPMGQSYPVPGGMRVSEGGGGRKEEGRLCVSLDVMWFEEIQGYYQVLILL